MLSSNEIEKLLKKDDLESFCELIDSSQALVNLADTFPEYTAQLMEKVLSERQIFNHLVMGVYSNSVNKGFSWICRIFNFLNKVYKLPINEVMATAITNKDYQLINFINDFLGSRPCEIQYKPRLRSLNNTLISEIEKISDNDEFKMSLTKLSTTLCDLLLPP